MNDEYRDDAVGRAAASTGRRRVARLLLLVGGPLALGAAFAVHPHGGVELLGASQAAVNRWFRYHLVLLPLLGLLGVCLSVLLADFDGTAAVIGRAGTAVYLVCYVAFEAIAGIGTGIVVREARAFSGEQRAAAAGVVEGIAAEPAVIALALLGTAGGLLAVVALGVLFRRAGAPLAPVVLLAGAPLAMVGHGGGYVDVFGMLLFTVGVAWLELRWRRASDSHVAHSA